MKKLLQWVLYSSQNPEKISLTLKAGLPFIAFLLTANSIPADTSLFGDTIDAGVRFLVGAGEFGMATITLFGFLRKLFYLFLRHDPL